jgi:diguanylate cyclase (GGDEF)-like protein/PAS domain S-box-containing protein
MASHDGCHEGTASRTTNALSVGSALRRRAEKALRKQVVQSQGDFDALSPEEMQQVLHELRVHQIELEMQNEELRRTQAAQEALQARYFDLFDLAPVGYCTVSEQGLIQQANLAAGALLGMGRAALAKQPISRFILKEDQDIFYLHRKQLFATGDPQSCELRMIKKDRSELFAHLAFSAALGEDGVSVLRIVLTDVTARKLAEDELRIAAVAFASQNGMVITDPKGIILRVNPAFTRLTDYRAEEVIGQTTALLKSGRHSSLFYQRIWESLLEKGRWQGEIWNKRKNAQIYAEMLTITAILTPDRGVIYYVGSFSDITDNKEAEAEIHRLAYYDPLTRLPNRRLLHDRLHQALAASSRSGLYGAMFFIDVDNFKALNDTRGHVVGDLLLIEVAQRLRGTLREGDTVARQGGDEFVVLLEDLGAEIAGATTLSKRMGDKLFQIFDQPVTLDGNEYQCKLCIGVSLFGKHDTVEDLFKHADLALYQAKNAGRNTLRFFHPTMQAVLDLRSALEAELSQALERKQLRLFYQPQVNSAGRMIGVEALLRWQHPQRGLVMPNEFIALAEDTGSILPIGLWVLETACAQLKTWENDTRTLDLKVAVNVSARQFRQPDLVAQIRNVLEVSCVKPTRLILELTESLVMEDVQDAIEKMQAIQRLGVSFSMDDFGTGYSSLSSLARLPLDQLKIDGAFVRNLSKKGNDATIARTIITMGREMTMNVIAEGVETVEQRDFLKIHGCHAYQGYLFSRPLPLDELEEFVKGDHATSFENLDHKCAPT